MSERKGLVLDGTPLLYAIQIFLQFPIENDYYDHNCDSGSTAMSTQTWTVAEAKAKFSELIEKAKSEGPQKITKHGRTTAVVVAAEDWTRKTQRKGNLAEFLSASPLRGSGLKLRRLPIRLREIEL
jgi:prevent-host-death family protein